MKIIFLLVFACLLCGASQAQKLTFFQSGNGKLETQQQIDAILAKAKKRSSERGLDFIWKTEILQSFTNGDTLFKKYKLVGASKKSILENAGLIDQKLPYFSFTDIQGNKKTSEDFKGKPMVVNLWYTTCRPCITEMPALNILRRENKDKPVGFLSFTFNAAVEVQNFLKKHAFEFAILPDAKDFVDQLTTSYPKTLFVDREGIIKHIVEGSVFVNDKKGDINNEDLQRFREGMKLIQ